MPAPWNAAWQDDPRPLSPFAWVDLRCRVALRSVTEQLWNALEPFRPRLIFLGGSASLGEAIGWEEESIVLSDLDLGAVTERWVPIEVQSALRSSILAQSDVNGPEVTVGFYQTSMLGRQAPSLGWIDLASSARPLRGEDALLSRMLAPPSFAVPAYEAFRLAGNRALELWRAGSERERVDVIDATNATLTRARWEHALAKAATGLWTSWLVLRGAYVSGLGARLSLLDAADGPQSTKLDSASGVARASDRRPTVTGSRLDPPLEIRAAATAYRAYFSRPSEANLPARGIDLYRLALPKLLAEAHDFPLERVVLREPLTLRNQLRSWRRESGRRSIGRELLSAALAGDPLGTWETRRLALALRYWLETDSSEAWRAACRRWIGRDLPHEPRSISRLEVS